MRTGRSKHRIGAVLSRLGLALVLSVLLGSPTVGQEMESQGWDVILLVDQSGSMFKTSDPCGVIPDENDIARPEGLPLRQWGAVKFIDYLGVDPSAQDQVGIICFGTEPGAVAGENRYDLFQAADLAQSEQAKSFLKRNSCPPDMAWTNINKALEAAYNDLVSHADDRQKVVILLTDGKPELAYDWLVEDTAEVQGKKSYYARHFELIELYKQAGIKLFIMALGENAQLEDPDLVDLGVLPVSARKYRDLWDHAAAETDGEYYKIEKNDQLWTTYHAIAAKLARVFPGQVIGGTKPPGILNENFQVPEAARMIVTVERDIQTASTLYDPDVTEQVPTRSDQYYQIYNFEDPKPGRWTLRFEGPPTRYNVFIDFKIADLNIEVVDLPQVHPIGKPLLLQMRISDDSGMPLEGVGARTTVIGADGYEKSITLGAVSDKPGVYESMWTDTGRAGDYELLFEATEGEKRSQVKEKVTLDELLYLELLGPRDGDYIEVAEAQFALKRRTERVVGVATGTATLQIDVTLSDSGGRRLASLPLSGLEWDDQNNVYIARFEDIPEGDYTFTLVLSAPDEGVTDAVAVNFHLRPPPTPVPISPTQTPYPTFTPQPDEPSCRKVAFEPIQGRVGEAFQLVAPMDTSQLKNQVVMGVKLNTAAPIELKTLVVTLPAGLADTPAELSLKVSDEADVQPGKSVFEGDIAFSVQDRSPFCSMSFSVEVWSSRIWLPEPNLEGKAGKDLQARVEYNTLGQTTVQPIKVSLVGVPSDLLAVDEESTTLTPGADKHGFLDVPIHIDPATTPQMYTGQMVFTYPDGTQDVSDFSVTVVPLSFVDQWWPVLIGLVALLLGIVAFVVADPLCLRCKLSGKLVYPNLPAEPDIVLTGNKQAVVLRGSMGGSPSDDVILVIRARKKKPPVMHIKQAANRVEIDGKLYQQGDRSIPLQPNAAMMVGSVQINYEGPSTLSYDYDVPDSTPEPDSGSFAGDWSESVPIDGYDHAPDDSLSGSPYDQSPGDRDQGKGENPYANLDYS